jgi:hypothetical protein
VTRWQKRTRLECDVVQVEVAHDLPEILVFHDIIASQELEEIKLLAQPMVAIFLAAMLAGVQNFQLYTILSRHIRCIQFIFFITFNFCAAAKLHAM